MGNLVFDIDGTLCFDGRTIAPEIVAALDAAAVGHTVVFASARPVRDLLPILPNSFRDADLVGGNGSLHRRAGRIGSRHFDPATRAEIDGIVLRHGLAALIDGDWDYSYTGDGSDSVIGKVHRTGTARNVEACELAVYTKALLFGHAPELIREAEQLNAVVTRHEGEGIIDLSPAGVTKAAGLRDLWGAPRDYIAFGNDANDRSLFDEAIRSYCVGGHPVGETADERIPPEGVADAIIEASALLGSA